MDDTAPLYKDSQQLVLKGVESSALIQSHRKDLLFTKGEDPLNSGDTRRYFYFVLSGKIKIYQIDFETSKEQILYILTRGDMFDVVSLLDGKPSEYISEVLEDARLAQVPLSDVKQMILDDAKFRQYFYSYLANQLRSMEELAVSLSFFDIYRRVLNLFVKFTDTSEGKPKLRVIDNLKHEDIAAMIGTVRKVLSRTLQKLKQEGVIETSRKKIEITNFQKLLDKFTF